MWHLSQDVLSWNSYQKCSVVWPIIFLPQTRTLCSTCKYTVHTPLTLPSSGVFSCRVYMSMLFDKRNCLSASLIFLVSLCLFPGADLRLKHVNLEVHDNHTAHQTLGLSSRHLVVRRGRPFKVTMLLHGRVFNPQMETLIFTALLGRLQANIWCELFTLFLAVICYRLSVKTCSGHMMKIFFLSVIACGYFSPFLTVLLYRWAVCWNPCHVVEGWVYFSVECPYPPRGEAFSVGYCPRLLPC